MKVTNIDLYKYFGRPRPSKNEKGYLHGMYFEEYNELSPKRIRPIMLIIPGGAYRMVSEREGEPIALHFLAKGYDCFWLDYSVAPNSKYPAPLIEAMMALTYLYKKAPKFKADPKRISVCGFSAGGHLAAMLSSLTKEEKELFPPLSKSGAHLKCTILSYSVTADDTVGCSHDCLVNLLGTDGYTSRFDIKNRLTKEFPPCFIWTTKTDKAVDPLNNSIKFKEALDELGIPSRLSLHPEGEHGLGACDYNSYRYPDENLAVHRSNIIWFDEAEDFLNAQNAGIKD